jgi:hypothetical protein
MAGLVAIGPNAPDLSSLGMHQQGGGVAANKVKLENKLKHFHRTGKDSPGLFSFSGDFEF